MTEQNYTHIKVPGFGCTYGHEFEARSKNAWFLLKHLIKGESLSLGCSDDSEHKGLLLVFPLEAGSVTFHSKKSKQLIDFRGYLASHGNRNDTLVAESPFLKVAVAQLYEAPLSAAASTFGLDPAKMKRLLRTTTVLPRSVWINEICHRYIFERSVAREPDSLSARFLEAELIKEAYYGHLTAMSRAETRPAARPEPYFAMLPKALQSALTYIEEHLFEDFSLEILAQHCAVSTPTLVRLFRKHTGVPPMRHLQQRRLTEARILLATGRYSVSEVAEIAGYSDSSSFSHAYQRLTGVPPSQDASRPENERPDRKRI